MPQKTCMEKLPAFLRTYKTEKFIRVDVPRVGIFFRFWQFMAFLLILAQLYLNDGWALSEVPGGISNAWDEPGTMLASTNDLNAKRAATPYCSNSSYSYSSEGYRYTAPVCEALLPAELTKKSVTSVFYTTAYLETVTLGWPCAAAAAASKAAACTDGGGITYTRAYGQCGCVTQRAVYPLAVEEMGLAFEHSFDTSDRIAMRGSSAAPVSVVDGAAETSATTDASSATATTDAAADADAAAAEAAPDEGLYSLVHFGNGSTVRFEAGQTVRLPLTAWLSAANVSMAGKNGNVRPDERGVSPPTRTTGINVKVKIVYTNADPNTRRAVFGKTQVHADVSLQAEHGTWTGVGVDTTWVQYPSLPRDTPQDFHLVEKWRQGILFQFATSGIIYKADFFYLLSVVLSGLVLLKFANTVTNFYAFNCLGAESVILRNKRIELASKKSEFAEIGMKAALAAATYPKFDRFCDGTIEAEDIARAFAHVEGISWEVAYMIAKNILSDADTEPSLPGETPGLNYIEFMTCLEGDAINFDEFIKDNRAMFDKHMAEDEARDAAKGKGKGKGDKEPSAKEKMKAAKALAEKKAKERKVKIEEMDKQLKAEAKAAGMDFDDFLKEKEDKEDDAMRAKCKQAYDEEKAEIEKHKPEDDGTRKKRPKAEEGGGGEGGGGEGGGGAAAAPPEVGPALELDDAAKAERLGKCGKLKVHLASASGLKASDKDGLSDPYVEAKLGKKSKKSKPQSKTLSPTWAEDMEIATKLSLKKVCKDGLTMVIMDKDTGMMDKDDVIGTVVANLGGLETSNSVSFSEAIPEGGVLVFTVEWEDGEAVEKKPKADKKAKAEAADVEQGEGETTQTL